MTNKPHRRRQAKPTLIVGDSAVGVALGRYFRPEQMAMPDPKQPGVHRWVATCMFTIRPGQAEHLDDDTPKLMDQRNLMAFGIGCVDCEQTYGQCNGSPCIAGDEWKPR